MKRLTLTLLLTLLAVPQMWAASANLTTNGSACPGATNTTALVATIPQDDGGGTLTISGTWTGTISFYGTGSGGVLWTALSVTPLGSSTAVTSATANGTWQVNLAGVTAVCMLSSASMTGTASVTVNPSAASARSNGGSGGGGSGTVTSITAGAGLSGGTITTSGTIAVLPVLIGHVAKTLTSAQILALKTTKVAFGLTVPSGSKVKVIVATESYTFVTTNYDGASPTGCDIVLVNTGNDPIGWCADAVNVIDQGSSVTEDFYYSSIGAVPPIGVAVPTADSDASDLYVMSANVSNFTSGDGTLTIDVWYAIIPSHN